MPLQAIAISDFNAPLMRETTQDNELKIRLDSLYEQDKRLHDFISGSQAIESFGNAFAEGNLLYVGMFNDKPICAVACQKMDNQTHSLSNLAMHIQNLNRGIEEQFIKLIIEGNSSESVRFDSNNSEISTLIHKFQK